MAEQYSGIQNKGWTDGFDISDSLKQQTKSINQSVSNFTKQTVNPIKSTVTDIKSGIALIKEKDREFLSKIYSYKSETIETINNYLSNLTGGRLNFSDFGKVITYKDGFNVNKDELMNMASKSLGFNIKNLPHEADNLAGEFLTELNSMTLGLSQGLVNFDGTRITIAGDWDRKLGENVFAFLTDSSNEVRTIRNFAASNAVLNVMLHKNAQIGYVQGYKGFADKYLYESDYHAALISSIAILLNKGDVNSLKEVIDILGKVSVFNVRATYPKFAETVFTNFNLPDDAYAEDYAGYGEKLVYIVETTCGDNWMLSTTFIGDVLNIGLVSSASASTKIVIEAYSQALLTQATEIESSNASQATALRERASKLIVLIATTGIINVESAATSFKRDFPNSVVFE